MTATEFFIKYKTDNPTSSVSQAAEAYAEYKNKELKEALVALSAAVFDNVDYLENGEIEKALIKAHPFITESK